MILAVATSIAGFSPARAEDEGRELPHEPLPLREDLWLDGEALADRVTGPTLETASALGVKPTESRYIPFLRYSLYGGFPVRWDKRSVQALRGWLLEKADHSVTLEAFFAKALEIENGNVQKALELGWNTLREDFLDVEERNTFPYILKLQDLTGELSRFEGQVHQRQLGFGKWLQTVITVRGDNFSAWYHFFGTALSAYYRQNSLIYPIPGKAETMALIFIEETILHRDGVDFRKRIEIDKAGARFGDRLARNLRRFKTAAQWRQSLEGLIAEDAPYLYDRDDIYGPSWHLGPHRQPKDFGGNPSWTSGPREGLDLRIRRALALAARKPSRDSSDREWIRAARAAISDRNTRVRDAATSALQYHLHDPEVRSMLQRVVKDARVDRPYHGATDALELLIKVYTRRGDFAFFSSILQDPRKPEHLRIRAVDGLAKVAIFPESAEKVYRRLMTLASRPEDPLYRAASKNLAVFLDRPEARSVFEEHLFARVPDDITARQALLAKVYPTGTWNRLNEHHSHRVATWRALFDHLEANPEIELPTPATEAVRNWVARAIQHETDPEIASIAKKIASLGGPGQSAWGARSPATVSDRAPGTLCRMRDVLPKIYQRLFVPVSPQRASNQRALTMIGGAYSAAIGTTAGLITLSQRTKRAKARRKALGAPLFQSPDPRTEAARMEAAQRILDLVDKEDWLPTMDRLWQDLRQTDGTTPQSLVEEFRHFRIITGPSATPTHDSILLDDHGGLHPDRCLDDLEFYIYECYPFSLWLLSRKLASGKPSPTVREFLEDIGYPGL